MTKLGVRLLPLLWSLAATPALPQPLDRPEEPPTLGGDANGGNFLFIPGIGKIPLPPGARGFGSGNPPDESIEGAPPKRLSPKAAMPSPPPKSREERQAEELDRLFGKLAHAEDDREADAASRAIRGRWAQSGSDTIDLLAARALAAETAGAPNLAKILLDYVVALSPYWSDGFVRRARALELDGDVGGALADLETAARLEPKRFDALEALGALSEKAGDKKRALDAYRKALAIAPRNAPLQKSEERLRIEVEGRDI
jgi:tetratricopeptide (TPR) repeat protein